jgi:hypothetical protein
MMILMIKSCLKSFFLAVKRSSKSPTLPPLAVTPVNVRSFLKAALRKADRYCRKKWSKSKFLTDIPERKQTEEETQVEDSETTNNKDVIQNRTLETK